jgi:hypothetical protein
MLINVNIVTVLSKRVRCCDQAGPVTLPMFSTIVRNSPSPPVEEVVSYATAVTRLARGCWNDSRRKLHKTQLYIVLRAYV